MEGKGRKGNCFSVVTVGIVGHCSIETLQTIKETIENLPAFDLVIFKTTSSKLWLKEGERP